MDLEDWYGMKEKYKKNSLNQEKLVDMQDASLKMVIII